MSYLQSPAPAMPTCPLTPPYAMGRLQIDPHNKGLGGVSGVNRECANESPQERRGAAAVTSRGNRAELESAGMAGGPVQMCPLLLAWRLKLGRLGCGRGHTRHLPPATGHFMSPAHYKRTSIYRRTASPPDANNKPAKRHWQAGDVGRGRGRGRGRGLWAPKTQEGRRAQGASRGGARKAAGARGGGGARSCNCVFYNTKICVDKGPASPEWPPVEGYQGRSPQIGVYAGAPSD
jgi:hypothetical protein